MSRPFAQMIDEIDPITPTTARNLKAVNRDLSTMSTVAKHLALTSWKPRIHNPLIMDFAGATVAIQEEKNTELRPPWKKEELECLSRALSLRSAPRGEDYFNEMAQHATGSAPIAVLQRISVIIKTRAITRKRTFEQPRNVTKHKVDHSQAITSADRCRRCLPSGRQ